MKNLTFILALFFFISCTTEEINHACDEFENATAEALADCTDEDIFLLSTGNAWEDGPGSPMYNYYGDSGQLLWWFGYKMDGCNLKFMEHEISWSGLPYLSRCAPHEIGNIDTWICNKVSQGDGNSVYYRDQDQEYFDGKTHANAVCTCKMATVKPDDWAEIGDTLYLKVTPPEE